MQLSTEMFELAQRFDSHDVLAFDAPELRRLERAWAALHDWEPRRLARVQLLNFIDFAVAWKARSDWWLRKQFGDQAPAYDAVWAAKESFRDAWPEYGAAITDDDMTIAVEIWSALGRPRRTTTRPKKWVFFAQMMGRIGLGGIKHSALSTDWQEWSKKNGRLAEQAGSPNEWPAEYEEMTRRSTLMRS